MVILLPDESLNISPYPLACHGTGRLGPTDVSVGHSGAGPNTEVCCELKQMSGSQDVGEIETISNIAIVHVYCQFIHVVLVILPSSHIDTTCPGSVVILLPSLCYWMF